MANSFMYGLAGAPEAFMKGYMGAKEMGLKEKQIASEAEFRKAQLEQSKAKAAQDVQEFELKKEEALAKRPQYVDFNPADAPIVNGKVASPLADVAKYYPNQDLASVGTAPYRIPRPVVDKVAEEQLKNASEPKLTPEIVKGMLSGDPTAIATGATLKGGAGLAGAYFSGERADKSAATKDERDFRHERKSFQDQMTKNPDLKDYGKTMEDLDLVTAAYDPKSGIGPAARQKMQLEAPIALAKAIKGQRVTVNDMEVAKRASGSLAGRVEQFFSMSANGTLSDEQAAGFADVAGFIADATKSRYQTAYEDHRERFKKAAATYGHEIDDAEADKILVPRKMKHSQPTAIGSDKKTTQPQDDHQAAINWVNDPANATNPDRPAVLSKLKREGLIK